MTQTSDTDSRSLAQAETAKLPAPPLRVFISYKQKDGAATIGIKRLLQQRGGASIEVFVSEDEAPGIQFRQHLLKKLREAHVLIFCTPIHNAACAERYAELVRGYRKEGLGSRSGV